MKIIDQSWEWFQKPVSALNLIEIAGRTCYRSENLITSDSSKKFIKSLIDRGHLSVIEHVSASIIFITNRGVTHELVRHRLASYSQESTRYVRYNNIEVIRPVWWKDSSEDEKDVWIQSMDRCEKDYADLLMLGWTPEKARDVLPNALKTKIVVTANLREWKHIFKLRCDVCAHPQIRSLMLDCRKGFREEIPIIFD